MPMINICESGWKMGFLESAGTSGWLWMWIRRMEHTEPHLCGPNVGPLANADLRLWGLSSVEELCPVRCAESGLARHPQ